MQFILLNVGNQHHNLFFSLFNLKVTFYVGIGMHFLLVSTSISTIYPECSVLKPQSFGRSSVTWAVFIALWTQAKEWSRWVCRNKARVHFTYWYSSSEIDSIWIFHLLCTPFVKVWQFYSPTSIFWLVL